MSMSEIDALGRVTLRVKQKSTEETHTLILLNEDGSAMNNLKFERGKTYRIVVPKRSSKNQTSV